uniref:TRAF-type domain-containing protein n=1 Tax=Elaeophora elaphi TaxID=1147741 RepID=A0A0R3RNC5_9BILA
MFDYESTFHDSNITHISSISCSIIFQRCDHCSREQKIRAFCYFCHKMNKEPTCAGCGKQRCLMKASDCLVRHVGKCVTGLQMMGGLCAYCETFICHNKKCLSTHPCKCPLRDANCVECKRHVIMNGNFSSFEKLCPGSRMYQCAYCKACLCEDDYSVHQAKCQYLDSENFKCMSCNRFGIYACLRCKICCCDNHVRRKGFKYDRKSPNFPCPKCGFPVRETKECSVSVRKHAYGRQVCATDDDDGNNNGDNSSG